MKMQRGRELSFGEFCDVGRICSSVSLSLRVVVRETESMSDVSAVVARWVVFEFVMSS
jgi:hypothetical protein